MLSDITLEGQHAVLRPLAIDDVDALARVGLDASIWTWMPRPVVDAAGMRAWVEQALDERARGVALPFAICAVQGGGDPRPVGSTRFGSLALEHGRIEIGWTWIAPEAQRSGINTECKLMLMRYAFEELGCVRVELKTDARNARSRAAILRIGACEEGILRKHMLCADGSRRDTVYFSVLDEEWPRVREALEARLARA